MDDARTRQLKSNRLTAKWPTGRLWRVQTSLLITFLTAAVVTSCGPTARIPPRPAPIGILRPASDSIVALVESLAPTLYLHPSETFPLERVVAVHHPERRLIAYHLLWRDDAHGAWIPFTTPTDQEIAWVAYDEGGNATTLLTYWHGTIVRADWRGKGRPAVDVQWGKHGMLPRATHQKDLPWARRLWTYYAFTWGLPDLLLGRLSRDGPLCFCAGYGNYSRFTRPIELGPKLDAVVVAEDPDPVLTAIFGENYSRKPAWP